MLDCVKCGAQAVVIPRLNDGFCRACFLAHTIHKFRAAIGKSKLIRDDERVLVAYSTGAASTCLLHLIREGVSVRAQKRLRFKSTIAFIDESSVLGLSSEERRVIMDHALSVIHQAQLPAVIAHIEDSLDITNETPRGASDQRVIGTIVDDGFEASRCVPKVEDSRRLVSIFDSADSVSDREDLLRILRQRLLVDMARRAGCTKVAVGDCSSRMAATFLSDLARGRGAHAPFNMGFSDDRQSDVQFFRPLKDLSSKEVAFYNRLNDLESHAAATFTTKLDKNASIERLTQDFITNLQAEYCSTVPNIVRTGEKLEPPTRNDSQTESCPLCMCPLDTTIPQASAINSVTVPLNLHRHTQQSRNSPTNKSPDQDQLSSLCYGCQIIASHMDDTHMLPPQFLVNERADIPDDQSDEPQPSTGQDREGTLA